MSVADRLKGEQALSGKLAQRILQYIDDQELLPGENLGEASLAVHLQVSRTPVRTALKVLADMGVVENHPNRGYFLRPDAPIRELATIADEGDATYFQIGEDSFGNHSTQILAWINYPKAALLECITDKYVNAEVVSNLKKELL